MITSTIRPIGETYNAEDMIIDTVERVYGVRMEYNDGYMKIEEGDKYIDSTVIDVFVHPESDCVWIVTECSGVYFEVTFDGYRKYTSCFSKPSYKHVKDSTELSGGHLW